MTKWSTREAGSITSSIVPELSDKMSFSVGAGFLRRFGGLVPRLLDEAGFIRAGEAEAVGSGEAGWTAEDLERLRERLAHYNRVHGTGLELFLHRGDPGVEHGIGVSENRLVLPLASSSFETRAPFFMPVADAVLMHEPGHERERRMFGIADDSILSHLAGGGRFEELYVGAKDYERGYSVPPMGELKRVIEADALLGRHVRHPEVLVLTGSLDLHCDARAFRDAESEVYVSDEDRKAGLGGRAVYLSQMLLYVGYQYAKLRGNPGRIPPQNIPQLARFSTVLRVAEDDLRAAPEKVRASVKDRLAATAKLLPEDGCKGDIVAFCDGVAGGKTSALFEAAVGECLPVHERGPGMALYSSLSGVYRRHMLLCVNRGERIVGEIKRGGSNPVQTLLSDLNDAGDERLRVRAATYLGEVGDLVAVDPLVRRFRVEESGDVRDAIVDTLLGVASKHPVESLSALADLSADLSLGRKISVLARVGEVCFSRMIDMGSDDTARSRISGAAERLLIMFDVHSDKGAHKRRLAVAKLGAIPKMFCANQMLGNIFISQVKKDHQELEYESVKAYMDLEKYVSMANFIRVGRERVENLTQSLMMLGSRNILPIESIISGLGSKEVRVRKQALKALDAAAESASLYSSGFEKAKFVDKVAQFVIGEEDEAFAARAVPVLGRLFILHGDQAEIVSMSTLETDPKSGGYYFSVPVDRETCEEVKTILAGYKRMVKACGPAVRKAVADSLGDDFSSKDLIVGDGPVYAGMAARLLERLEKDADPSVRKAAEDAIGRLGDNLQPVEGYLPLPENQERPGDIFNRATLYRPGEEKSDLKTSMFMFDAVFPGWRPQRHTVEERAGYVREYTLALHSSDGEGNIRTLSEIRRKDLPEMSEEIINMLGRGQPKNVRRRGFAALQGLGSPQAYDFMLSHVSDGDETVGRHCIRYLGKMGRPQAVGPILERFRRGGGKMLKSDALWALARIYSREKGGHYPEGFFDEVVTFHDDESPHVRRSVLHLMARVGHKQRDEVARRHLKDEPMVSNQARAILASRKISQTRRKRERERQRNLREFERQVRRYAKTGIMRVKENALSISRTHENTRFREECVAQARRLASDANPRVRAAAADVLAEMNQEIPAVLFDDPDVRVRALAYVDLLNRHPEEVPGLMERALASNEQQVACQAIYSFNVGEGERKQSLMGSEFARLKRVAQSAMDDGRASVAELGEAMASQLVDWADAAKGSYRIERIRRRLRKRGLGGNGVFPELHPVRYLDDATGPTEEDELPF